MTSSPPIFYATTALTVYIPPAYPNHQRLHDTDQEGPKGELAAFIVIGLIYITAS